MTATLADLLTVPEGGWTLDAVEALGQLPVDAPRFELIEGSLVMRSPQKSWHSRVMRRLTAELEAQTPVGMYLDREMAVVLTPRTAPEPDVLVVTVPYDEDRTRYSATDVALAVEVVSPESEERDRESKPGKYARAGIPHFWRIERDKDADGQTLTVIYTYELDPVSRTYLPTGKDSGVMTRTVPFPMTVDVTRLNK